MSNEGECLHLHPVPPTPRHKTESSALPAVELNGEVSEETPHWLALRTRPTTVQVGRLYRCGMQSPGGGILCIGLPRVGGGAMYRPGSRTHVTGPISEPRGAPGQKPQACRALDVRRRAQRLAGRSGKRSLDSVGLPDVGRRHPPRGS